MAFTSLTYLFAFLLPIWFIWLLFPAEKRPFVLLAGSIVYYGSFGVKYMGYILLSVVITWGAGRALGWLDGFAAENKGKMDKAVYKQLKARIKTMRRAVLWGGILLLAALLLWLKYSPFFAESLNGLLGLLPGNVQVAVPVTVKPLGISFYSLMAIAYLQEVYQNRTAPGKLWQVGLFLGFWPHIVEGPFDSYTAVSAELCGPQKPDWQELTFGLQRMVWGLFKIYVISYRAALFADAVFDDVGSYAGMSAVCATLLYTLQLYADFSGAIDLALGTAQLFGVHLAENFRQPFFSRSVAEFWRRWHMSLGTWLRECIFQPFSLSKPCLNLGKACKARLGNDWGRFIPVWTALFVTWLVTGLWHGAAWIYVVYGLYYFVLQCAGQLLEYLMAKKTPKLAEKLNGSKLFHAFEVLRTFVLVNIGMLLFRSNGLMEALRLLARLFRPTQGVLFESENDWRNLIVAVLGALLMLAVDALNEKGICVRQKIAAAPLPLRWALYILAVLAVIIFGLYGSGITVGGFLYAEF